jgi:hypothetical protein
MYLAPIARRMPSSNVEHLSSPTCQGIGPVAGENWYDGSWLPPHLSAGTVHIRQRSSECPRLSIQNTFSSFRGCRDVVAGLAAIETSWHRAASITCRASRLRATQLKAHGRPQRCARLRGVGCSDAGARPARRPSLRGRAVRRQARALCRRKEYSSRPSPAEPTADGGAAEALVKRS